MVNKIIVILIYLMIIIIIPFFIDYLFKLTLRKKRENMIKNEAQNMSKLSGKPLVYFYGCDRGEIDGEEFTGDIAEIINQMANDSCTIVTFESLEYVNDVEKVLNELKRVAGGDLFMVNVEKKSPRAFWDYQLNNLFEKSQYRPSDKNIKWDTPNDLQLKTQKIYEYIFCLLPYSSVSNIIKN